MPCVDADGSAVDGVGDGEDVAGEQQFNGDDAEQDPEGVGARQRVGIANEGDAFEGDGEGGASHGEADDGGGDGLGLAVAVGMHFIGRADRDAEADVNDGGAEDVGEGFYAIGEQGEGVADEAGEAFAEGEEEIRNDAEKGRAEPAVDVLFWFRVVGHERSMETSILRCEEGGNRKQGSGSIWINRPRRAFTSSLRERSKCRPIRREIAIEAGEGRMRALRAWNWVIASVLRGSYSVLLALGSR